MDFVQDVDSLRLDAFGPQTYVKSPRWEEGHDSSSFEPAESQEKQWQDVLRLKERSMGEYHSLWKAKCRNRIKEWTAYPSRHIWLPSKPLDMKRHLILDNSDSEDEMPNAERIMGRDYESLVFDDGNYVNSSDFDAFAAKLYQTEQSNPAVAPHSCSHCEKLQLDLRRCKSDTYYTPKRVEHGIAARGPGWRIDDVDICTLAEAKDAGALECVLLERLFSAAKKIAGCDISLQGEDSESKWRHSVGRKRIFLLIFVTRTEENPLIQLFFELEDEGSIAKYEIFALAETRPSHRSFWERVTPNLLPNSELHFLKQKFCIDNCHRDHKACQLPQFTTLFRPKRLLEIIGDGPVPQIRLSSTKDQVLYATLSYCWGGDQPGKTLKENVRSYEVDIPFPKMPRTIQDAIVVTRGIGLKYLWVDAMCIIQDDDNDKKDQIGRMHSIYKSSFITIAAAVADKSIDGFLHPRTQWQPIRMKARFDDNVFSDVALVPVTETLKDAVLFTRGWTFQETQLSTRMLLYGHRELIYVCKQGVFYDGGIGINTTSLAQQVDPGNYAQLSHPQSWGAIVGNYSARNLTVGQDKLLAVSALAEEYSRTKNPGKYFAGIWESDFLRQCLWQPQSPLKTNRPIPYRAPSWSWASLEGSIRDFDSMPVTHKTRDKNFDGTHPETCKLISVNTKLAVPDSPFGMVTGGHMTVHGRMRKVVWSNTGTRAGFGGRMAGDTEEDWPDSYGVDERLAFYIDVPTEWPTGEVHLWSLEVIRTGEREGFGLLLKEVNDREGTFRRAGLLRIKSGYVGLGRWFDIDYEWRQVVIV